MKLSFHIFNLELRDTFTISHGSRNFQPSLIVEISHQGHTGYGEAAATSYYGVSIENMIAAINAVEGLLQNNIGLPPEELWNITAPYLKDNPFAQCALDMAVHDLFGKRTGQPLYKIWGLSLEKFPLTNYTIGIDTVEKMVQKMTDFPWPVYKIKMGTSDDVTILRELRKHTAAIFRVDANAAWTAKYTLENCKELEKLNVEFIEQPLPVDDWKGMKEVFKHSVLPVIADESCSREEEVQKCAGYFHGVNIKLTKCGGITPARRMINEAKALNMKVMMGCMTESTVGISAIAQFLPLLDYVDMDGAMLLKTDIAEGVKIYNNEVHFPEGNGTGVSLLN